VLVVANNWAGTADIVDPHTFERLTRLNIVPDLAQRRAEIFADPVAAALFVGNSTLVGEGHDQYVDDAFTSHDGRTLYVSRPSLADVVAIDLGTRAIVWRTEVDGVSAWPSAGLQLSDVGRPRRHAGASRRPPHLNPPHPSLGGPGTRAAWYLPRRRGRSRGGGSRPAPGRLSGRQWLGRRRTPR